ncbi:hypothetical protein EJP67_18405 [Variovorax guangxiensis]|uniref:Uncharacterized protein n=1 Tax=Variovorax guangxiensis TaxID=1775474 RepID=A0A433MM92_9BURK|nr:hypothetical protein [Variovorax guangxiensis]RUR69033.1 hypothetical protein EJP67_18405 [Variovorax guangxiensis]
MTTAAKTYPQREVKIEFFVKATGEAAPVDRFDYFIRDGAVWRDNFRTCESQMAVVGFEDFIMECPEIGWRVAAPASAPERPRLERHRPAQGPSMTTTPTNTRSQGGAETLLPCPFCGTAPQEDKMLGVWCSNDDCSIVGQVFSGGARHWNTRALAAPASAQEAREQEHAKAQDAAIRTMLRWEREKTAVLHDENRNLREALQFYADGNHFTMHDANEWDTVSGEPANFYEDSSNTATVEDGSVAKLALAATPALSAAVQQGEALTDAVVDFLEAQDALDNREFQGINGEDYFTLRRRRNLARDDLAAALASAQPKTGEFNV